MAKNGNGKTRLIFYIIVSVLGIAGVLFGVLEVWFVLPVKVEAHQTASVEKWDANNAEHDEMEEANMADHISMETDIKENGKKCEEIIGIKKDVLYLGQKVDRNWEEQKAFQQEQKQMTREILTELRK